MSKFELKIEIFYDNFIRLGKEEEEEKKTINIIGHFYLFSFE